MSISDIFHCQYFSNFIEQYIQVLPNAIWAKHKF